MPAKPNYDSDSLRRSGIARLEHLGYVLNAETGEWISPDGTIRGRLSWSPFTGRVWLTFPHGAGTLTILQGVKDWFRIVTET